MSRRGRASFYRGSTTRHIVVATLAVVLITAGLALGLYAADTVERTVAPHATGVERAVSR